MQPRALVTRRGSISFPAYIPVTTFGQKYPLDQLVRPYLPRLASAVMVSHYYAQNLTPEQMPRLPLLVDSGGFALLLAGTRLLERKGLGVLEIVRGEEVTLLHPRDVLEFQSAIADVAFTLDFPIPPNLEPREAKKRQRLTIANAHWAIANRRRQDLPLYACVQAWDADSARRCAQAYVGKGFDGVAIGGLVPRSHNLPLVLEMVEAVRGEIGDLPLHVFGLGHPQIVQELYQAGVDSVDSSSYVRYAADGKLWANPNFRLDEPTPTDRLHLALCNLATATGKTLPLSTTQMLFSTLNLAIESPLPTR
jgi:tRNA-guanine family transglycosylase